MCRRNLSLLIAAILIAVVCHGRNARNPNARVVAEGFNQIDEWALDRPADDELIAGAMRGMVDVLRRRGDEHSRFLKPQAAQQLREELSGDFGGVGVRISLLGDPPQLTVVGPPEPGTPAFHGGVEPDDRIVAIDGEPTAGATMPQVLERMRGGVGEPVTLTIVRGQLASVGAGGVEASNGEPTNEEQATGGGKDQDAATGGDKSADGAADAAVDGPEPITITLVREIIHVDSVRGDRRLSDGSWRHLLEQDQRVGLARITTFGDDTLDELRERVPAMLDRGMRALVIDLRENAGGSLDSAVDLCNLFLPPGAPIVETRGRDGGVLEAFSARGGPYRELPLAVLINGNSASASEIMAACLQDNERAVCIGERSFGKGTVQRLIPLQAGKSLLKLTSASFWRPSGENIHRMTDTPVDAAWGVRPSPGLEVLLTDEQYAAYLVGRSARDVMPVDGTLTGEQAGGNAGTPDPEQAGEAAAAEEEAPAEFVDPVLERAVEHLQSLLDASVSSGSGVTDFLRYAS